MFSARISAPYKSAADAPAIAASPARPSFIITFTAPAVSYVATASISGCAARNRVHCASATGCDSTRRTSPSVVPGRAITLRRIRNSASPAISSPASPSSS